MFDRFVGIDWSGAKGPRQRGIQMSLARPGRAVPERVMPPDGRAWGRDAVYDWLLQAAAPAPVARLADHPVDQSTELASGGALLVGIDFAFAHPFMDEGTYYPGLAGAPDHPAALWQMVDRVCADDPHLYGGAVFADEALGDYYLSPRRHDAPLYRSRRRLTEQAARASGRAPSPTFKAIGADNVATGSMAGMRLIHALKQALGDRLAVWPFDPVIPPRPPSLVLVEIFPSWYFHAVGMNPAKNAAAAGDFMSAALSAWESVGVGPDYAPRGPDADEADAMVAAAALRQIAGRKNGWQAPPEAAYEGWIFGVPA